MAHWKDCLDPDAPGGRYLPWKEVGYATGLSRTTAWRLQRRGEFPRAYPISPGRVGYLESEVEAWKVSRRLGPRADRRVISTAPGAKVPRSRARERPQPDPPTPQPTVREAPVQPRPARRRNAHTDQRQITFDF